MLRVTPFREEPVAYRLQVEGRLAGASALEVLRQALIEAESRARPVVVELSELRFADDDAVKLLAQAVRRGVALAGCSPWLTSLLEGSR